MAWFVYLMECADGTLCAGATTDPARREREHNAGAKYTRARRPVHRPPYSLPLEGKVSRLKA